MLDTWLRTVLGLSTSPADLGLVGALEQVAPRTGRHRLEDRRVVVHGQHQHRDVRAGGDDPPRGLDPVEAGQLQVQDPRRRAGRRSPR
jgi:hypothetical protein